MQIKEARISKVKKIRLYLKNIRNKKMKKFTIEKVLALIILNPLYPLKV
jgi:hypothetical protein